MKPYTVEIEINLPRDRVVELFDDSENLFYWQNGLQSFEHISGEPGQPGAQSRMTYKHGKHQFDLIETITENNLPDEFNGTYEWKGGSNTLINKFIEVEPGITKWESTCDYTLQGIMMKLMGWFFPHKFKEQNMLYLKNFKRFCEEGYDVRHR